jgi:hypothetical protein
MRPFKINFMIFAFLALRLSPLYAGELTCKFEASENPLIYVSGKKQFSVVDLAFTKNGYVGPGFFCARWLDELKNRPDAAKFFSTIGEKLESASILHFSGPEEIRLRGEAKSFLYQACAASPLCSVRFPYFFSNWTAFKKYGLSSLKWFRASAKSENSELCSAAKGQPRTSVSADAAWIDLPALPEDQWRITPLWTFVDQTFEILANHPSPFILISTMSLSEAMVDELKAALRKQPAAKVLVLFDYLEIIQGKKLEAIFKDKPGNLYFMPVFRNPSNHKYFHVKGVVADTGEFSVGSTNFTNKEHQSILDLSLYARDPKRSVSFARILNDLLKTLCGAEPYLSCSMEAEGDRPDSVYYSTRAAFAETCQLVQSGALDLHFPAGPNYFVRTDQSDFLSVLIDQMDHAQSSILAFTHQMDHPKIVAALKRAQARGVQVELIAGSTDHLKELDEKTLPFSVLRGQKATFLEPHSKGMLIDGANLISCSGNLTLNGMEESTEICFKTREKRAISEFYRYFKTSEQFLAGLPNAALQGVFAERLGHPPSVVFFPLGRNRETELWKKASALLRPIPGLGADFLEPTDSLDRCLRRSGDLFLYSHLAVGHCI